MEKKLFLTLTAASYSQIFAQLLHYLYMDAITFSF